MLCSILKFVAAVQGVLVGREPAVVLPSVALDDDIVPSSEEAPLREEELVASTIVFADDNGEVETVPDGAMPEELVVAALIAAPWRWEGFQCVIRLATKTAIRPPKRLSHGILPHQSRALVPYQSRELVEYGSAPLLTKEELDFHLAYTPIKIPLAATVPDDELPSTLPDDCLQIVPYESPRDFNPYNRMIVPYQQSILTVDELYDILFTPIQVPLAATIPDELPSSLTECTDLVLYHAEPPLSILRQPKYTSVATMDALAEQVASNRHRDIDIATCLEKLLGKLKKGKYFDIAKTLERCISRPKSCQPTEELLVRIANGGMGLAVIHKELEAISPLSQGNHDIKDKKIQQRAVVGWNAISGPVESATTVIKRVGWKDELVQVQEFPVEQLSHRPYPLRSDREVAKTTVGFFTQQAKPTKRQLEEPAQGRPLKRRRIMEVVSLPLAPQPVELVEQPQQPDNDVFGLFAPPIQRAPPVEQDIFGLFAPPIQPPAAPPIFDIIPQPNDDQDDDEAHLVLPEEDLDDDDSPTDVIPIPDLVLSEEDEQVDVEIPLADDDVEDDEEPQVQQPTRPKKATPPKRRIQPARKAKTKAKERQQAATRQTRSGRTVRRPDRFVSYS